MKGGLMVCGTASDVGKSHLVAGLCRLLARRGVSVAPFKAQNMALNSFVTRSGHEIGRAQAAQASAAGIEPEPAMNPILLKPATDSSSEVMVMGRSAGYMNARDYQGAKPEMLAAVLDALSDLRSRFDVVICEGAGSPAEINLLDNDIVNLRIAYEAGFSAVIVADIDRGGALAALCGTVSLLPERYRALVRGFIINKFRGDPFLLDSGLVELERRCNVGTLGVLPFVHGVSLDAEDSLALGSATYPGLVQLGKSEGGSVSKASVTAVKGDADVLEVSVVRFPRMSNFTDIDPLVLEPSVNIRFVDRPSALVGSDLIVLPGSKTTVADLAWIRSRGIEQAITAALSPRTGTPASVLGICGGYQMLGHRIVDEIESSSGLVGALGHLDVETVFSPTKITRQRAGSALSHSVKGYEIRHGNVRPGPDALPWIALDDRYGTEQEGASSESGHVMGTSLHGLFEQDEFRATFLELVAARRGKRILSGGFSFGAARKAQFDFWADLIEDHLDVAAVEKLIKEPAR